MKPIQYADRILTLGKKIIYQPLPSNIPYEELTTALEVDTKPIDRPGTFMRDKIRSLIDRVTDVLEGKYRKSGRSRTSAFTKGAHTHFWQDPDLIKEEGVTTTINTKRLLNCASGRYINEEYDIDYIVEAKKALTEILEMDEIQ